MSGWRFVLALPLPELGPAFGEDWPWLWPPPAGFWAWALITKNELAMSAVNRIIFMECPPAKVSPRTGRRDVRLGYRRLDGLAWREGCVRRQQNWYWYWDRSARNGPGCPWNVAEASVRTDSERMRVAEVIHSEPSESGVDSL